MTPEEFLPLFTAFALCASCGIFILFFAIPVFLGYAVIDIWNVKEYLKPINILLLIGLTFFPEIGVMSWAIHFGRDRKHVLRVLALVFGGLYSLLQISFFLFPMLAIDFGTGLGTAVAMRCLLSPFFLIGGGISVFVLRAILTKETASTTPSETQQEYQEL